MKETISFLNTQLIIILKQRLNKYLSGMYEISPYATFNVAGNHSRSVTASTLDYTMQFKTFGHIDENGSDSIIYPKHGKHSWHKHRYYNNEGIMKFRLIK